MNKILITGHPKTGTTYLCRVLDCLFSKTHIISKQLSEDLKRIYRYEEETIIFSYLNNPLYHYHRIIPNYSKIIILYRDFRDVLVSCYFQQTERESKKFYGSIDEFVFYKYGGIEGIVNFYNNVEKLNNILKISYENIAIELKKTLEDIGIKANEINNCFDINSFEKMRLIEVKNFQTKDIIQSIELCPKILDNYDSYKTRKGKIGGYVDYLSDDSIEYINNFVYKNYLNSNDKRWRNADLYS